jgi:hypothetical protein
MVNCARGSSNDELADDFACACCAPPSSSAPLGIWREPSPARGADGRRATMRDSMRKSRWTGYRAEINAWRKKSKRERRSGNKKGLSVHLHLTGDIGAVKRSTLV